MYYCPDCKRTVHKSDNPAVVHEGVKMCSECSAGRKLDPAGYVMAYASTIFLVVMAVATYFIAIAVS